MEEKPSQRHKITDGQQHNAKYIGIGILACLIVGLLQLHSFSNPEVVKDHSWAGWVQSQSNEIVHDLPNAEKSKWPKSELPAPVPKKGNGLSKTDIAATMRLTNNTEVNLASKKVPKSGVGPFRPQTGYVDRFKDLNRWNLT